MIIKINPNLTRVRQSATLAINQKALKLREEGREIVHFGFGQSPFPVHPLIRQELEMHSDKKEYLPTFGLPALRETIASYFTGRGYDWQARNIVVGPGSKELLFDLMLVLDGALILPTPCWVSYHPQAQIIGKLTLPIYSRFEDNYKPSLEAMEEALHKADHTGAKQKLLLLNSPSNPLGTVFTEAELQSLADFANKHNLIILSDEIYSQVRFDGKATPGISAYAPDRTIVTSGLSKAFSAGGYRLGFAFIPDALSQMMKPLAALISETFSCVSSPIQYAACRAYSDSEDINRYVEKCTRVHGLVAQYVRSRLMMANLDCLEAAGGFYLFPNFERHSSSLQARGIKDSRQLCDVLLEEAGVALLPAEDFGLPAHCFAARLATVDYDGATLLNRLEQLGADANNPAELVSTAPKVIQGCDALSSWMEQFSPNTQKTISAQSPPRS